MFNVSIWVDGACSGNPGPGGWAAVLQFVKADGSLYEKECSGSARHTTNNLMELSAVAGGLSQLTRPCNVTVHTDSQVVIAWLTKGRCDKSSMKAEIDLALRQVLHLVEVNGHTLTFEKVKGHAGVALNERCDVLARAAIQPWLEDY